MVSSLEVICPEDSLLTPRSSVGVNRCTLLLKFS